MADHVSNVGKNLERFRIAAFAHDRENPTHSPAYGVCVSWHDLERLGFEDGEELWGGFKIFGDSGTTGNFRIVCDRDDAPTGKLSAEEAAKDLVAVGFES